MIMDDTGHALLCICVIYSESKKRTQSTCTLLLLLCVFVCAWVLCRGPFGPLYPSCHLRGEWRTARAAGQYKSTWCTKTWFTWNGQMWLTLFEKIHCEWTIHWIPTRLFFGPVWLCLSFPWSSSLIHPLPPHLCSFLWEDKQQKVWGKVSNKWCGNVCICLCVHSVPWRHNRGSQPLGPVHLSSALTGGMRRVIGQNTTGVSSDNSTLS